MTTDSNATRETHLVYDDEGTFLWSGSRVEVDRVAQKQDGARITKGRIDDDGNVTGEVDVWRRDVPLGISDKCVADMSAVVSALADLFPDLDDDEAAQP